MIITREYTAPSRYFSDKLTASLLRGRKCVNGFTITNLKYIKLGKQKRSALLKVVVKMCANSHPHSAIVH